MARVRVRLVPVHTKGTPDPGFKGWSLSVRRLNEGQIFMGRGEQAPDRHAVGAERLAGP